jgi:hypothetical protein
MDYNNSAPEWFWKLSPILPQLWDSRFLPHHTGHNLRARNSLAEIPKLGIKGKGDGGSRRAKTKPGRRKIEE